MYDDWDSSTKANEKWRNDPQRRAEWEEALAADRAAFIEATDLLEQACQAINRGRSGEVLFQRVWDAVHKAKREAERNAKFIVERPTDTYIGNKAAFGRPRGY